VAARRTGLGRYTSRIGPEPLEDTFTPFVFAERLKAPGGDQEAIMDQRRVAGVGNIYANERCSNGDRSVEAHQQAALDELPPARRGDRRAERACNPRDDGA